MRNRRRRLVVATSVISVGLMLVGPDAQAQASPSVSVTPDQGLSDRQVVTVTASGFVAQVSSAGTFTPSAYQCRGGVFPASFSAPISSSALASVTQALNQNCGYRGVFPATSTDTTTLNLTVTTTVATLGTGGDIHCGVTPGDCVIVAAGLTTSIEIGLASAPISFAEPTPQSKDDCRNDGWRRFVDDEGRPFRNQGQCISFANQRR